MKLYAIIENEEGKQVKIGSNERITATLYEGNKKQYAVNIEWTDIGDIELEEGDKDLPEFHAEKGSIITTQEWRNEPDERREMNCRTIQNFGEQHPLFHSQKMKDWRKGKKQQGEKPTIEDLKKQAKILGLMR